MRAAWACGDSMAKRERKAAMRAGEDLRNQICASFEKLEAGEMKIDILFKIAL